MKSVVVRLSTGQCLKDDSESGWNNIKNIEISGTRFGHADALGRVLATAHLLDAPYHLHTLTNGTYPRLYSPTNIIYITTRQKLRHEGFNVPGLKVPGCEFYREPFRFSQRLFVLLLQDDAAGTTFPREFAQDSVEYWLSKIAHTMHGQLFVVHSFRQILGCLDQLIGFVPREPYLPDYVYGVIPACPLPLFPPGISVKAMIMDGMSSVDSPTVVSDELTLLMSQPVDPAIFEKDMSGKSQAEFEMALDRFAKHVGYWPIPETLSAMPDGGFFLPHSHPAMLVLLPLIPGGQGNIQQTPTATPMSPEASASSPTTNASKFVTPRVQMTDWTKMIPSGMPFNKIPIDPKAFISRKLLELVRTFAGNHKYHGLALCIAPYQRDPRDAIKYRPWGFIKCNTQADGVNLFILPWNFPCLFDLLEKYRNARGAPKEEWFNKWRAYLENMPSYYCRPLQYCLNAMGLQQIPTEFPPPVYLEGYREKVALAIKFAMIERRALYKRMFHSAEDGAGGHEQELSPMDTKKQVDQNSWSSLVANPFDVDSDGGFAVFQAFLKVCGIDSDSKLAPVADVSKRRKLLPRTKEQAEMDLKHRVPARVMTDHEAKSMREGDLRLPTVEEEEHDKAVRFGNPFRTDRIPPGFRRRYRLRRVSGQPQQYGSEGDENGEDRIETLPVKDVTSNRPNSYANLSKYPDLSTMRFSESQPILMEILHRPFQPELFQDLTAIKQEYFQHINETMEQSQQPLEGNERKRQLSDDQDLQLKRTRMDLETTPSLERELMKHDDGGHTFDMFAGSESPILPMQRAETPEPLSTSPPSTQRVSPPSLNKVASEKKRLMTLLKRSGPSMIKTLIHEVEGLSAKLKHEVVTDLLTEAKRLRRTEAVKYLSEQSDLLDY